MAVTNRQCRRECKRTYGSNLGGRVAGAHDKGPYGYDNDTVDCSCIYPWRDSNSQTECDEYCERERHAVQFCHYVRGYCLKHVGLVV